MIYRSSLASTDPYLLFPVSPERTTVLNRGLVVNLVGDTARIQVSPHGIVGVAGTKTIGMFGQSNIANFVGTGGDTAYTPSNSGIFNIDTNNGGLYEAQDNLLGSNGTVGSVGIRLADQLIDENWATKIVLASMAIGGISTNNLIAGGDFSQDIPVGYKRLAAIGLTADIIIIAIGETDSAFGMSQATFTANGLNINGVIRAAGFTCPILWTLSTYQAGAANATIRAAISAIPDNVTVFLGADTDTLTGANRADTTHFTQAGADLAAGLHKDAILAL